MRVNLKDAEVQELLQYSNNTGVTPRYGKDTMKGVAWCTCGCCTGNLIMFGNKTISGFLDTECIVCGKTIDYSEVAKYV